MSREHHGAFLRAIELAGGITKLAGLCGCSKQNLHEARKLGRGLPARYVLVVERELGLSRHATRPDIFGQSTEGTKNDHATELA